MQGLHPEHHLDDVRLHWKAFGVGVGKVARCLPHALPLSPLQLSAADFWGVLCLKGHLLDAVM